jgi:phospholipid transport system substrate-binding protein
MGVAALPLLWQFLVHGVVLARGQETWKQKTDKEYCMAHLSISKFSFVLGLAVVLTLGTAIPHLWSSVPGEQVKATIDKVMEVLRDPTLQSASKKTERREKLRQIILPRFDFTEMAKRALGSNWNRYPDQQREFVTAFTQLLEETYADQIEAANGDKVVYVNERTDKNYAEVATKVISAKGEETSMIYKLHSVESDWKVYDIVVENVSVVNNYRAQFSRVLSNASMDELIKRMKEKRFQKTS